MDQITEELLSRYLDGDLDERETQEFEARLEQEPELQESFASMNSLKGVVAQLATSMEPPDSLDILMEPLRRSQPKPRGLHHAYGLLAAAATIVIGIGIAFELQRRHPQPVYEYEKHTYVASKSKKEGYFQLKALPTAVPGEELLGATEHLLAEPKPESPEAEEPPALVVVGPLTEEDVAADEGEAVISRSEADFNRNQVVLEGPLRAASPDAFAPVPGSLTARSARQHQAAKSLARSTVSSEVVIDIDGVKIRRAVDFANSLPEGRYALRLAVIGGRVARCESKDGTDATLVDPLCRRLIGLDIDAQSDCSVDAEIIFKAE